MVAATEFFAVNRKDRSKETAETKVEHAGVLVSGFEPQAGRNNGDGREGVVDIPLRQGSRLTETRLEGCCDDVVDANLRVYIVASAYIALSMCECEILLAVTVACTEHCRPEIMRP